ncbi:8352_t:CDS:2 [Ambispora leptoticha]|uniref:8352_t:CDS:1 n=1 Tax=Ambispora leptoticha TaxID=144679 RepID=A0A9N8YQT5_9GLOM|nr:8352_t:CDS:2 [Ambispora leptoticha]
MSSSKTPPGPAPTKTTGPNILSTVSGDEIKSGLVGLEKIGVADDIERGIKKIDKDTPDERQQEERKITHRIYKLDIAITCLLYYTSLTSNWLTLLGSSKSIGDFFYKVLIGSFNFTEWNFDRFDIVGKISGVTCSLQIILFVLANVIVLGITFIHPNGKKGLPVNLRAPIYYGGPFQFIHLMKPSLKEFHSSVRRIDAQFSQVLEILSQLFIIVAATIATHAKLEDITDIINANPQTITPNTVDNGLSYLVTRQYLNNTTPTNITSTTSSVDETELTLAVQNAALFTKTTLVVSTVGIIMTSFLNVLNWISNVWRINQDDLIIYEIYKIITRVLVCYPCCGDRFDGGNEEITGEQAKAESQALMEKENQNLDGKIVSPALKKGT